MLDVPKAEEVEGAPKTGVERVWPPKTGFACAPNAEVPEEIPKGDVAAGVGVAPNADVGVLVWPKLVGLDPNADEPNVE